MVFQRDLLTVKVFPTREEMGRAAAGDALAYLKQVAGETRVIFAAAPSQSDLHAAMRASTDIDWQSVTVMHMDEYIGLSPDAPQGFGNYLARHLFNHLPLKQAHYIDGNAPVKQECARYSALLTQAPIDVVLMGIGENGHIAFNDPPVADFTDPAFIKRVELDAICRQQQVNDGCFATLADVPTHALTLTIPALMLGKRIFCIVPGPTKARAVYDTLCGEVTTQCPASALRTHADAILYLDAASAALLPEMQ